MLEKKRRRPYWRETKSLVMSSLAPPLLLILSMPLWLPALAGRTLLGLPAEFAAASFGVCGLVLFVAVRFVRRQDAIDHWHGAHEDH
jgi:putative solute:sodium symporter small subunit